MYNQILLSILVSIRDRPKTGFTFPAENEIGAENEILFSARNRNKNKNIFGRKRNKLIK